MRRVGALTGLTAVFVLSFAFYLERKIIFISFGVILALLLLSILIRKYRNRHSFHLAMCVGMVAIIGFALFTELEYKPIVKDYQNKLLYTEARVIEEPYESNGKFYYSLETDSIGKDDKNIKILLKSNHSIKIKMDDKIAFKCSPKPMSTDYYKTKGYYLIVDNKSTLKYKAFPAKNHTIKYYMYSLRSKMEKSVSNYMDNDLAEICNAIAFGDKNGVSSHVKEVFSIAGISHILVVSGLHMTLISAIVLFIFSKIFRKRIIYCPLVILFVLGYMIMTGMSYSVVRSGIMVIIMLLSKLFRNRSESLNSLGIAGLVIVVLNPYSAGDIGFLLSFTATLGIIVLPKYIKRYIDSKIKFSNRIINSFIDVMIITLSANVFTAPILIIFFHNISLLAVITNVLVSPIFSLLLALVVIGGFLSLTGVAALSSPFLFAANYLAQYLFTVAKLIGKIPFSYVNTNRPYVYYWMLCCGVMILVIFLIKNYKTTAPVAVAMVLIILVSGTVSDYFTFYNKGIVTVYDMGDGITATISYKGKSIILSCGGDYSHYNAADKLEDNLYTQSYNLMSITDKNKKRNRYVSDIIDEFDLNHILVYDDIINRVDFEGKDIVSFKEDYSVNVGEINIQYLVRDKYIYTYVTCDNKTMLILPVNGDCSLIEEKYRSANIVVTDSSLENSDLIKSNLLIISCTEESSVNILGSGGINSNDFYATFNGNFTTALEVW